MPIEESHIPSIKTDVSDFCLEFSELLAPFETSLQTSLKEIQSKFEGDALTRPLAGLTDAHHRLETLLNKVKEQQAYVLIFGPLKSGKSTLMNAISATYVSEVTSLPAYPCLVHVKHGEDYKFTVTRYNGEKLPYADNKSLQMLIQESHKVLADRIRQVEENGEEFDPGVHYPDAIRRIDVQVPARNLKDSLTVLVDTPGLYTRMKFGYDLITREFRNSAACAVFVVKTDNLFLEQVFDEFNQLLDLFSRIFLVVNIDSNKRDLEPDGSFKPSLESESPEEIVRAFESLVMSAPLRKAAEEGRLQIYPIDLLNAASASLKDNGTDSENDSPDSEESSGEEKEEENAEIADTATSNNHPVESFSAFLNDLTEYLNSNDYLQEFIGDSLHQGDVIASEIREHCSSEALDAFQKHQDNLRLQMEEEAARLAAVEKLESLDWSKAFEKLSNASTEGAKAFGEKIRKETEKQALERLDQWLESDESLDELEKSWNELFENRRQEIEKDCIERFHSLIPEPYGGIELNSELQQSLNRLEQTLEPAMNAARSTLKNSESNLPDFSLKIPLKSIKMKKGFWDWILFRSHGTICRRIFGEENAMTHAVPSAIKKKRLDEEGQNGLREAVISHLVNMFPQEAIRLSDHLLNNYIDSLSKEFQQKLQAGKKEYSRKKSDCERRLQHCQAIRKRVDDLSRTSSTLIESISELKEKHHAVSWDDRSSEGSFDEPEPEISDDEI